jgi:hypothetical protein
MGISFGAYFLFLIKEKLPAYYDENKISSYSHGAFEMSISGLTFNNSKWPHIINTGRIWAMAILTIYPVIYDIFYLCLPAVWNMIVLYFTLIFVLAGLFIPMYIVGRGFSKLLRGVL